MKKIVFLFILVSFKCFSQKGETRKDSVDVLHYTIHLDVTDFTNKTISGYTDIKTVALVNNLDNIRLELFKLTVDSVTEGSKKIIYNYNDSILKIYIGSKPSKGDTFLIRVYYHGKPKEDISGFGGFSFKGNFAYNLGVGFRFLPHNASRCWFPCIDNFLDKATFSFYITSPKNYKAFCGGLLQDSTYDSVANKVQWHWEMKQLIPPYLASIAVAKYYTFKKIYHRKNDSLEIVWGTPTNNVGKINSVFNNLIPALRGFEKYYGPYRFERVGYVYVPENFGAMEHASNIGYPQYGFDGLYPETIYAHELAHHWWGNLITCSSAEDMWLNEGWASYSESIFKEFAYGKNEYRINVRGNHLGVLRYAHWKDGGFRALSPMNQQYTYGSTVYNKGADVAHSLRGYLGDSLFFKGINGFLNDYTFKSASSDDFMKSLSKHTGTDLSDFFNIWVYNPGQLHFALDSFINMGGGKTRFTISQQKRKALVFTKNIPLKITAYSSSGNEETTTVILTDSVQNFTHNFSFEPLNIILDKEADYSDATTKQTETLKQKGIYKYDASLIDITTDSNMNATPLFVVHHWVGAKRNHLPSFVKISTQRYWTVEGNIPKPQATHATIMYDGRATTDYNYGYLDEDLLGSGSNEDSLRLLYRRYPQDEWKEYTDYKKNTGTKTNRYGTIIINNLKAGEYTLCMSSSAVIGMEESKNFDDYFRIYPNPACSNLRIENINKTPVKKISLINLKGENVFSFADKEILWLDTLPQGYYFIKISTTKGDFLKKIVKE